MITVSGGDNSAEVATTLPVTADTHGRLRLSKGQRRELLAALARSGESLPVFARRTGLKYSTLANWVRQGRPQRVGRSGPRFLEAVVEPSPVAAAGSGLVLQLPGGVRVEVAEVKQVALAVILVRELSKPC